MSEISADEALPKKGTPEHLFERTGVERSADSMEEAREEANRLIREAKKKASDIEREAYEKAFDQGEKAGLEIGRKKAEPFIHSLHETLEGLNTLRQRIYERTEGELVRLTLATARSIIHREITGDKEVILDTIRAALKNVIGVGEIKIKINPFDIAFVREWKPKILSSIDGLKNITLEEDTSILQGGCIVETDFGDIDARIEKQIEEAEELLRSCLRDSGS
ncbi:MAG: FliH/SctL family protein [Pseudomonadota bacterium]